MKIRRYYGNDCNSVSGFNNGYYIDSEAIEVKDTHEAYESCKDALKERFDAPNDKLIEIENGFEVITGYYDNDGNPLLKDAFDVCNESEEFGSWSYVYITFEEV